MPPSGSSICLPVELRCVKGRVLEVRVCPRPRATSMVVAFHVSSHVECRNRHPMRGLSPARLLVGKYTVARGCGDKEKFLGFSDDLSEAIGTLQAVKL